MIDFPTADGRTGKGYLAVPEGGAGPGVLLLHSWWGFRGVVRDFCDELAGAGFVTFAPDLWDGKTADTREEAEGLLRQRDLPRQQAVAEGSVDFLRHSPEVTPAGAKLAAVGFSLGASWAIELSNALPEAFSHVAIFYDDIGPEPPASVRFQAHFGEEDEFASAADLRAWGAAMAANGREDALHLYPGGKHWFMEADRPGYFLPDAAARATERLIAFLKTPV